MHLHPTISLHQPMIPQDLRPHPLPPQLRIDLIEEEDGRNSGPSLMGRALVTWSCHISPKGLQ